MSSLRPLFKNDMRVQGVKLMSMLDMIVYNLPESDQVLPAIRDLAVRHAGPGGADGLLRRTCR
jgi:nitric oxide dioxygenase